jgi:hypothetical protein
MGGKQGPIVIVNLKLLSDSLLCVDVDAIQVCPGKPITRTQINNVTSNQHTGRYLIAS